jgi:hypothetical protein
MWADQIQMQNGDRYIGRLVAMTNETLIVQSEMLGTLRLPREKVVNISLGPVTGTNKLHLATQTTPSQPLKAPPFPKTDSEKFLGQMRSDTNSIRQIQQQFLADAGPEANKKFAELAEGLLTGKINLSDLRSQASSAAEQLRTLKREGGGQLDGQFDGYLAILESFLKEMPTAGTSVTNRPAPGRKQAGASLLDDSE